jgi:hypothetical protein
MAAAGWIFANQQASALEPATFRSRLSLNSNEDSLIRGAAVALLKLLKVGLNFVLACAGGKPFQIID